MSTRPRNSHDTAGTRAWAVAAVPFLGRPACLLALRARRNLLTIVSGLVALLLIPLGYDLLSFFGGPSCDYLS